MKDGFMGDEERGGGEGPPVLFEVKMIINKAPLTNVYPDTIQTCLTPPICYLADSYYIVLIQHQLYLGI